MTHYLYAVHDAGAAHLIADAPGYCVITEAIGCDPYDKSGGDYSGLPSGVTAIVRLNNGYGGEEGHEADWPGTIPTPDRYGDFAERVANYIVGSRGAEYWLIANEPNHHNERPQGQLIEPIMYADCFNQCYELVKWSMPHAQLLTAAVAPWDATTSYPGNENGDWVRYFHDLLRAIDACDGIALHTYARGDSPSAISSEAKMLYPFEAYYNGFRCYRDFIEAIPKTKRDLPLYITEFDEINPWTDANTGIVQAAYREIDEWNQSHRPAIYCLTLYRWRDDQWQFATKNGVQADLRAAVALRLEAPASSTPPVPEPPFTDGGSGEELPARDIDPRLLARGVVLTPAKITPGQQYWRVTKAEWLPDAANQVGPDHHILGEVLVGGVEKAQVPLWVDWPSGSTTVMSKTDQPNASFNFDYAMSKSLNEYGINVADGAPSDRVSGIGMGAGGNPAAHTSTWITFSYVTATEPPKPEPPADIQTGMVTAPAGVNVRSGPGTDFAKIGALAYHSTVLYDREQTGWLRLANGWVSSEYIGEPSSTTPWLAPPPAPTPPPLMPIPPATEQENWQRSLDFVLKWEGGWADDPNDPGGATMKGITLGTYTAWCKAHDEPQPTKADLRTISDAEVEEIYYEWYWLPPHCDKLAWPLCLSTFNLAVNAGVGQAEQTLLESNGDFLLFMAISITWYTTISGWPHYGQAWTRRNADVLRTATT